MTSPTDARKALAELVALIEKRRWTCTWKGSEDEPAVERARAVLATAPADDALQALSDFGQLQTAPAEPPKEKSIGEAFDTGHSIIVATPVGYELSPEHNCDAMGCGAWHVLYRFAKASANA